MKRKRFWIVLLAAGCVLPLGMECFPEPDIGNIVTGTVALPAIPGLPAPGAGLPAFIADPLRNAFNTQLLPQIPAQFRQLATNLFNQLLAT